MVSQVSRRHVALTWLPAFNLMWFGLSAARLLNLWALDFALVAYPVTIDAAVLSLGCQYFSGVQYPPATGHIGDDFPSQKSFAAQGLAPGEPYHGCPAAR